MSTIPAYSIILWDLAPGYPIPGPQSSAPVPAGFVWVVRTVKAYNQVASGAGKGIPQIVLSAGGFPIWMTPFNGTATAQIYEFGDTRVVMDAGDKLSINTDNPDWVIRASGFQLSA